MIMPRVYLYVAAAALAAAVLTASHWKAFVFGRTVERAEWVEREAAWQAQRAELARQAQSERERGRAAADRLAAQLAEQRSTIESLHGRLQREIQARTSATRRCLDAGLTRMLNETSVVREHVGEAGAAAAGVDAQASAAAADRDRHPGAGASERSVAVALAQARTGYESCRSQLHRLIDWVEEVTR